MAERLNLEAVSYSYPLPGREEAPALVDVDLDVEPGEVLCVAGPNGSGKSTLAQVCAGLLSPGSGSIRYAGEDVEGRAGLRELRRRVGLLFQSPEDQIFADTVERDIAFGPRNHGLSGAGLKERVREAAAMAGLPLDEILEKSPFLLSEGEKRRVALAGVLALNPEVLLLDEPFIGLDFEGRQHLSSSLERYRDERGASIMIVTHDLSHAWPLIDRFAIISEGRLHCVEDRAGMVSGGTGLAELGMQLPQWGILAGELLERGVPLDDPADPGCLAAAMASYREARHGR